MRRGEKPPFSSVSAASAAAVSKTFGQPASRYAAPEAASKALAGIESFSLPPLPSSPFGALRARRGRSPGRTRAGQLRLRPAGPDLRKVALGQGRKPVVENPGNRASQNRVARKFEPFVALARKFVGARAVSESRLEKGRVPEPVSKFPSGHREGAFAGHAEDRISR